MSPRLRIAILLVAGAVAFAAPAAPAAALDPGGALCSAASLVTAGANPCGVVKHAGGAARGAAAAQQKLLSGQVGGAVGAAAGAVGSGVLSVGLASVGPWVLGSAQFALNETSKVLGTTTSPQLRSTWFSGTYWRMAGISAVLTLPFLFAAAVQALLRSDLSLLLRAALLHLPLSALVVSIAAPLTMLLLAASDELSAIVSGATGNESGHFLTAAGLTVGNLSAIASPFLAFLIGVFTVAGAIVLWIELLMRETAVYVIVLMLPLAFAAFVWPARRVWAVRTIEVLGALILSKFAIVAVLSLGGAALGSALGHPDVANWLAGLVLVLMAAFMPWALLRVVPLTEIASSAVGSFRHELRSLRGPATVSDIAGRKGEEWISGVVAHMRRQAQDARAGDVRQGQSVAPEPGPEQARGRADPRDTSDPEQADPGEAPETAVSAQAGVPAGTEAPETDSPAQAEVPAGTDSPDQADGPPPARSAGAPWDSELLDAEPQTRGIACLDPAPSRAAPPDDRVAAGHPDPLPPSQPPSDETT